MPGARGAKKRTSDLGTRDTDGCEPPNGYREQDLSALQALKPDEPALGPHCLNDSIR